MKINIHTTPEELTLTIRMTPLELEESFGRAFRDYELQKLVVKTITAETGPLAAEIRKHVTVAIEGSGIVAQAREVVRSGLAAGLHEVEIRLREAGAKAAENAFGRFLGSTFARMRRALDFDDAMSQTAASVQDPNHE